MYFHTCELDPDQPRISAASYAQGVRHYPNLRVMESRLEWFLARWRFGAIADHLGLETRAERPIGVKTPTSTRALSIEVRSASGSTDKRK